MAGPEIKEIREIYGHDQIIKRVEALAADISRDYYGKNLRIITVLKSARQFSEDLQSFISVPYRKDSVQISSYKDDRSSGHPVFVKDFDSPISHDEHLLVVEDMIDTGTTLESLINHLKKMSPESVEIAILLKKTVPDQKEIDAKYIGFRMKDNPFVVGYGIDYNQKLRDLPYIGAVILEK